MTCGRENGASWAGLARVSVGFVINVGLWVASHGYGAGSDC